MKILLATTNKAKIRRYGLKLKSSGIEIVTLSDLGINYDVDEDGIDPIENAIIKAEAYYKLSGVTTIAIDDGLYLENVPDNIQPATNVRRVNGKRLSDEEMIKYYTNIVNKYGNKGKLNGYFLKGIAIATEKDVFTFDYKVRRQFRNKSSKVINEGYPLASLQFIEEFNKFKSELTREEEDYITIKEEQLIFDFIWDTILKLEK